MPIREMKENELVQRCTTCAKENHVAIAGLEAGSALGGFVEPRVIVLPPCPCGSQEFLIASREPDGSHGAPGSVGHLHGLLVDHLHAILGQRGQIESGTADLYAARFAGRRSLAPDIMGRWFPQGLRIDLGMSAEPRVIS